MQHCFLFALTAAMCRKVQSQLPTCECSALVHLFVPKAMPCLKWHGIALVADKQVHAMDQHCCRGWTDSFKKWHHNKNKGENTAEEKKTPTEFTKMRWTLQSPTRTNYSPQPHLREKEFKNHVFVYVLHVNKTLPTPSCPSIQKGRRSKRRTQERA